ncbi:MAG: 30S ribosomal protein S11 [Candidatus Spechtbacteria bacterium]|nr:30S ribosomal protein S11 [Candidatus Spechtbacteria bacterium]
MGKKRVAGKPEEEVLKESDESEAGLASKNAGKKVAGIKNGKVYIKASYNNVLITITDEKGSVLSWASSGNLGFKGPKKATPFAASKAVETAFERLGKVAIEQISVLVSGIGGGRDAALRAVTGRGVNVVSLKDITPIAHNGCRPKRVRHV